MYVISVTDFIIYKIVQIKFYKSLRLLKQIEVTSKLKVDRAETGHGYR